MSQQQAWYKQFWPWFLIILPACAVVASLTTLKIALDNSDSLVAEEYYKEGKAINMDLRKVKYAQQLGMQYSMELKGKEILLSQEGGPAYQAALDVQFYHPTQAEKDFRLKATADAKGIYHIKLDKPIVGNWEVRLESYDSKWRIHKRLNLKDATQYWLN
ncbi:FixH family protein [Shewanella sp. AS16]|uniref:FixH family protein n=1 Tax=Shewanella sp. AS16 TaxID=2907625 RepID=UPI001F21FD74|nr:FixH family protein [Shewanella sp. AS16]MCE9687360.1 FixH family protein [Shewanella sp. AS16]